MRPWRKGTNDYSSVLGKQAKKKWIGNQNPCITPREGKAGASYSYYAEDIQVGDEEIVVVVQIDNAENDEKGEPKRSGGAGSSLRRTLTTAIGEWGHIRPPTNVSRNATAT